MFTMADVLRLVQWNRTVASFQDSGLSLDDARDAAFKVLRFRC